MNSLTSREREIALALAEGLSNKDVGRRLNLSEGTVKVHLHNIYSKLGVKNRTALAVLAYTKFASAGRNLYENLRTSTGSLVWLMSPWLQEWAFNLIDG
jgi:two-component system nitrate/nitrite response regulator NarL